MARKTLDLDLLLSPDNLGREIAATWIRWDQDRREQLDNWTELQQYIFQTDTRQTANSELPWKNSTTIPKICQIRDNLFANYKKIVFPRRKWLKWLPDTPEGVDHDAAEAIRDYMAWVVDQSEFKAEFDRFLLDYIDYGNVFGMPVWIDETQIGPDGEEKVGYVGPKLARISPTDIVMNPVAASPQDSSFIVRSWYTIGEFAKKIQRLTGQELEEATATFNYMKEIRHGVSSANGTSKSIGGDFKSKQEIYNVAGFDNFITYLQSNYVEVLTFYGDLYDVENNHLYENYEITVVDRHKIVSKRPSESILGMPPIIHTGWRKRQDSLWAMGPLENLVGLQYRLDHLENMKADVLDLTVFPPIKVKGYVEPFQYGPGERIFIMDDGDVELLSPDVRALQINLEMDKIMQLMEEMAGAPKEALGFRTPGEKTAFEVDKLFTASNRLFNSRSDSLEENFVERGLNMLLELAKRKLGQTLINIFDDDNKIMRFSTLDKTHIAGTGKVKPIGSRHFSEQSEVLQNMIQFANTPLSQDPNIVVHFSGQNSAQLLEEVMNLQEYGLYSPYVRVAEQAELAQLQMQAEEMVQLQGQTPAGVSPDDFDEEALTNEPNEPATEDEPAAEESAANIPPA
jgi:hypothetical protein